MTGVAVFERPSPDLPAGATPPDARPRSPTSIVARLERRLPVRGPAGFGSAATGTALRSPPR